MLFGMFYRYRNIKFLRQWSHFLVLWGSGYSGNNSPVSNPALFLIYFLGASLLVPMQFPLLFTFFIYIKVQPSLCWQKEH